VWKIKILSDLSVIIPIICGILKVDINPYGMINQRYIPGEPKGTRRKEKIMALVGTPNTDTVNIGNSPNTDEFKAKKALSAKKHAEKVKAEKQKDHEEMLKVRDELKSSGKFDSLSQSTKDYILAKCVPPGERIGHSGPSFFTTLYGDNPAVGASITLQQVIDKTFKGIDAMNSSVKQWAKKGIEVTVALNQQNKLASTYTITKLPA
jgi:hypothetical protein